MHTRSIHDSRSEAFSSRTLPWRQGQGKYSDRCVEHFLTGDIKSLFGDLKRLSKTVLTHFKPMIPEQFHSLWKTGIDTNAYYLKLCGSGGGGYILGFTEDISKAQYVLKDHRLEVVYTF